MIEAVYAAYFEHGQDIGDSKTLLHIGAQHGMDAAALARDLYGAGVQAQVMAEAQEAQRLGINGVPFFILNHRYGLSGAQPPEAILEALRQVAARTQGKVKDFRPYHTPGSRRYRTCWA